MIEIKDIEKSFGILKGISTILKPENELLDKVDLVKLFTKSLLNPYPESGRFVLMGEYILN
jgi:hypothetical protein